MGFKDKRICVDSLGKLDFDLIIEIEKIYKPKMQTMALHGPLTNAGVTNVGVDT